jgi:hypothetical protein
VTPLRLSRRILDQAREFFEDRGAHGLEGTALIAQTVNEIADRLVIPVQRADRLRGSWVEVPLEGKLQLAAALGPAERFVSRIHSHPGDPFHSPIDDANPVLTFQGAFSIVVPFFGLGLRRGLDACGVYMRHGDGWVELSPGPARDERIVIV